MYLYNTLSRSVEEFKPLNPPHVGMYTCGPTVYDFMHIGNLRTFIFSDVLLRVLIALGYDVTAVRNVTDIEDKIIKKAKEEKVDIKIVTDKYTQLFFEDLGKLNILSVNENPKATVHIQKMVKYIEELINKGLAYVEKDGSIYFSISKFPDYGKLSQLDKRQLQTGTRVLSDEYSKDNVQDFALWKSVEASEFGYDSPWGKGRPGWHIECSVMSQEYLGETLDIHTGGVDLIFPHHENEIAQSEGKTGKKFANYFVHAEHLLVDGQKMSKSLKNFYTLNDLMVKGFDPISLRHLVLTAHYRDRLNFTWESLQAAQNALDNLRSEVRDWILGGQIDQQILVRFMEAMENDLNTSQALAVMWELVKSDLATDIKSTTILEMDKVLGLNLADYIGKPLEIPQEVQLLIEEREGARNAHNFERSDELRQEIKKFGFEVEDTPQGMKVKVSS